ncbi:MAG: hypothetical protein J0I07_44340 [Myxococcales bacterium]|nr:hypothetical protein [Myxococcales bacterium]
MTIFAPATFAYCHTTLPAMVLPVLASTPGPASDPGWLAASAVDAASGPSASGFAADSSLTQAARRAQPSESEMGFAMDRNVE